MDRMTATCPHCGGTMVEKEDEWFLCYDCDFDANLDDLPQSANPHYYPLPRVFDPLTFLCGVIIGALLVVVGSYIVLLLGHISP